MSENPEMQEVTDADDTSTIAADIPEEELQFADSPDDDDDEDYDDDDEDDDEDDDGA